MSMYGAFSTDCHYLLIKFHCHHTETIEGEYLKEILFNRSIHRRMLWTDMPHGIISNTSYNYIHHKVCGEITYPLPISAVIEVWEWISYFISPIMDLITYPCWGYVMLYPIHFRNVACGLYLKNWKCKKTSVYRCYQNAFCVQIEKFCYSW